jgi:putative MATE family efflux protein
MKDMTTGPVRGHVLSMSAFIAMSTLFQTLYFLADLFFVGKLGPQAVAGVMLGGNLMMFVVALTQSLGVGTTAVIGQSLGARDTPRANTAFNQAFVLSLLVGVAFAICAWALREPYCRLLAADAATAAQGLAYLGWFIPALFMNFILVAMGAALRGMGDMKAPMLIQIGTVVLNVILAPVFMFGWLTGRPMGVAGTALASFIAVVCGAVAFTLLFRRARTPIRFHPAQWAPQPKLWWQMLRIGLPAGGEFVVLTAYLVFVYGLLKPFGSIAQAGFGIGGRVMQAMFLPAVAVGFAAAPVAAQNFGARQGPRVRETFRAAGVICSVIMIAATIVCHIAPRALIGVFSKDAAVIEFGANYLRIISWNFLATGLIFASSSVFQGMGNTVPPLLSSFTRLLLFMIPAWLLSRQPGFDVRHVWYLSVGTVLLQLFANLWLLQREFDRRLRFPAAVAPPVSAAV